MLSFCARVLTHRARTSTAPRFDKPIQNLLGSVWLLFFSFELDVFFRETLVLECSHFVLECLHTVLERI